MNKRVLMGISAVGMSFCCLGGGYPSDLVYYSKFDSSADIASPQVGDGGTFSAAAFVPGVKGNAANVQNGDAAVKIPLKSGLPIEKGALPTKVWVRYWPHSWSATGTV